MTEQEEYHDVPDVWEDFIQAQVSESEIRDVLKDYNLSDDLDALTDLTEDQINLFVVMRSFIESYPGLGLEGFPKWFMKLRLSLERKSRTETKDILAGRLLLKTREEIEEAERGGY